jgi:long-chain acyl-CoA synthetase
MAETTIHAFFATAARLGLQAAVHHKGAAGWKARSWTAYAQEVREAGQALVALGVRPGDAVAILGPNRPEWLIADLAAMAVGAVPAPIYPTLTAEQSAYVAAHAGATVAVVHDRKQLEKLLSQRQQLARLRCCVLMEGEPEGAALAAQGALAEVRLLSWAGLLALSKGSEPRAFEERLASLEPSSLATLIYTSGTTGPPKAVMLSHRNLAAAAKVACETVGASGSDRSVSYLPLSHIAEQMLSLHVPAWGGGTLWCCERLEELPEVLREARPTWIFGVPRVWEKLAGRIEEQVAQAPPLKRTLFAWARAQGLAADDARLLGKRPPLLYPLAHKLVLGKLHQRLGLDESHYCGTGAAPISRRVLDFWRSLGLPLHGVWGLSELSGAGSFHRPGAARPEGVGPIAPGMEARLGEDGEILIRGAAVFTGYLKDEAASREVLEESGWFHTGDVGRIDERGHLHITDRKKDLIITSGGKNVSPQNLELLLTRIPGISQAVVVGDDRKFLAALLTLDSVAAAKVAVACGARGQSPKEWASDPAFIAAVQKGIEQVNAQLAQFESIKRFRLLPLEFSIEGGELTPTMKIKRKAVGAKYAQEIEALFA